MKSKPLHARSPTTAASTSCRPSVALRPALEERCTRHHRGSHALRNEGSPGPRGPRGHGLANARGAGRDVRRLRHASRRATSRRGMVRDDLLMQIQADVLGLPVVRPRVTETTALGGRIRGGARRLVTGRRWTSCVASGSRTTAGCRRSTRTGASMSTQTGSAPSPGPSTGRAGRGGRLLGRGRGLGHAVIDG